PPIGATAVSLLPAGLVISAYRPQAGAQLSIESALASDPMPSGWVTVRVLVRHGDRLVQTAAIADPMPGRKIVLGFVQGFVAVQSDGIIRFIDLRDPEKPAVGADVRVSDSKD